ncbi:hypothetical protein diail_31 [Diaporthe ilicicola]|nr:hypothetical protein diail_31 [Diaporthe ilicicola]
MDQQASKAIPFTEDPTEHVLTEYMDYTEVAYPPMFCDHQKKGDKIHLVAEATEEGEGVIERKDVYVFVHNFLKRKNGLSGYWTIEGANSLHKEDADTLQEEDKDNPSGKKAGISQSNGPSLPVFQFGTLGLEIYPRDKDTIKLGTLDVNLMLEACLEFKKGQRVMPKLSGQGTYDETKKKFRWSLRGPTLESGSEAGSGGERVLKKLKSLFQK